MMLGRSEREGKINVPDVMPFSNHNHGNLWSNLQLNASRCTDRVVIDDVKICLSQFPLPRNNGSSER
jgi:hypothetical protein